MSFFGLFQNDGATPRLDDILRMTLIRRR